MNVATKQQGVEVGVRIRWTSIGACVLAVGIAACGGGGSSTDSNQPASEQSVQPTTAVGTNQVSGTVFEDLNRNRTLDGGESLMGGQTVVLMTPDGGEQLQTTETGADGAFRFENVGTGAFRVRVQIPEGYERTSDDSFVLTVESDGTSRDVQFGLVRLPEAPAP